MDKNDFLEIAEECRGNPPSRLVYGRKGEGNYNTAKQLPLFTEGQATINVNYSKRK